MKKVKLFLEFWVDAIKANVYVRNRAFAIESIIDDEFTSSLQTFIEMKSSIDHIRVWECKCYFWQHSKSIFKHNKHDKLIDSSKVKVFVEYDENITKHYDIYISKHRAIEKFKTIIFAKNESREDLDLNLDKQTSSISQIRKDKERSSKAIVEDSESHVSLRTKSKFFFIIIESFEVMTIVIDSLFSTIVEKNSSKTRSANLKEAIESNSNYIFSEEDANSNSSNVRFKSDDVMKNNSSSTSHRVQTLLRVEISKRKRENTYDDTDHREKMHRVFLIMFDENEIEKKLTMFATKFSSSKINILTSTIYKQTIENSIWRELWRETIQVELIAFSENNIWEKIVLSKDANIVTSKWIFKSKLHVNDTLDKLKIKLIIKEFTQMYEVNYEDTFVSTTRFDTLRLFLAIIALKNLECHQVNVNNVFIEFFLKKTIYMSSSSSVKVVSERVLRILRSLYDLKQVARDWHERCIVELLKLRFQQCVADSCLLIHYERQIMLLIYVNDIAVVVKAIFEVIWFKNAFKKMFKIKNLRKIEKILEIRITRDRQRRTLRMNQTHYLKKVIDRLHMRREDKHKSIDILMNEYVALRSARSDDERTNQLKYQQAIESLMYVAIHTRSNIAFSLRRLNQYLNDSTTYHWHVLKSLIRYVRSIIDLNITYESSESIILNEYFDFDYAIDAIFRKSILEYVYMFVEDSIFWMSKKQKFVTISIIEVEYMTMSICAKKRL